MNPIVVTPLDTFGLDPTHSVFLQNNLILRPADKVRFGEEIHATFGPFRLVSKGAVELVEDDGLALRYKNTLRKFLTAKGHWVEEIPPDIISLHREAIIDFLERNVASHIKTGCETYRMDWNRLAYVDILGNPKTTLSFRNSTGLAPAMALSICQRLRQ